MNAKHRDAGPEQIRPQINSGNAPQSNPEATLDQEPLELEGLAWINRFSELPDAFFTRLASTPLPDPYPIAVSEPAARLLDLDPAAFGSDAYTQAFTGNRPLAGGASLASVYSGHQFGVWAGQLGDGRAIMLGEARSQNSEQSWELQLKGSGQTPYSRTADGRAVLRSSVREFLCSEAMHALGIPTTRALSITGADYPIIRETVETAAVVSRLSPSFIRFGHFEHYYYNRDEANLKVLADFVIKHFYPECLTADNPYQKFLTAVSHRTAKLMAQWQSVGFCHGVMNTDNMSILGLTIDYGPFGFLDGFELQHICNHTDHQGRYTYANQPKIGQWNCFALGQSLVPLIGSVDETTDALADYQEVYQRHYDELMNRKLGLALVQDGDAKLIADLLHQMDAERTDMTIFFRRIGQLAGITLNEQTQSLAPEKIEAAQPVRDMMIDRAQFDQWLVTYLARLTTEQPGGNDRQALCERTNPAIVLRNHLAQIAIDQANQKNFDEIRDLLAVLQTPFTDPLPGSSASRYAAFPPDWAQKLSVSCSS